MNMQIPFVYEESGTLKKRNRTTYRLGHVERDVASVTSQDAPVAAEWRIVKSGYDDSYSCRHWNGGFYRPSNSEFKAADLMSVPTTSHVAYGLIVLMGLRGDFNETRNQVAILMGDAPVSGYFGLPLETVASSNETERRAKAQGILDALLLIDGVWWTRIGEPKLVLDQASGVTVDRVATEDDNDMIGPGDGRPSALRNPLVFNLRDLDEMRFQQSSRDFPRNSGIRGLVVHKPEAFLFDAHAYRLRDLAFRLVDDLAEVTSRLTAGEMGMLLDLREAMGAAGSVPTADVEMSVENVISVAERHVGWGGYARRLEFIREMASAKASLSALPPANSPATRR